MPDKERMSFSDVVVECFDSKELVAQWERLYGMKLVNGIPPRSAIEAMVDRACGHVPTINEDAASAFMRFVWDCVWTRLPPECFVFTECDGGKCCD